MQGVTLWIPRGVAAGLVLLLTLATAAADDTPVTEPADPRGTKVYMDQLRSLFDAWDLNSDGYLDKAELAKAFRGPDAKPFDYVAPSKTKKDDTAKDDADKPKVPESPSPNAKPQPDSSKQPDYSQYPDYVFLKLTDTNMDDQVSRHEFLEWSRGYAKQLKQLADQLKKQTDLQNKLAAAQAANNAKQVAQIQKDLKAQSAAIAKATSQQQAFDKALQSSLNKKH